MKMRDVFIKLKIGMVFRDDIELFEVFSVLRDKGVYVRLFPAPRRLVPACTLLLLIQSEDSQRVFQILKDLRREPVKVLELEDDIISLHFKED
ncbi:MAG: hypothetical protein PWQ20_1076 [Thermotogaceae bacterium]|nr:hypothetical protein [Thermotogaceae bacterium]MDN5338006.1 hypothetical protein [Thermotogaceae bacterium]